ncbi:MAG: DUF485 domain-containing protein [Clostridia bacterium]|nr:DUF485 domain-containing protein [Clostridia bacterium]
MSTESQKAVYTAADEKKMDMHSEEYLQKLMSGQLKLSLSLFSIFLIIVVGLPLANLYVPEVMNTRIFGFTFSWLFLGVLFYPLTWLISWVYVKKSIAFEEDAATWVERK